MVVPKPASSAGFPFLGKYFPVELLHMATQDTCLFLQQCSDLARFCVAQCSSARSVNAPGARCDVTCITEKQNEEEHCCCRRLAEHFRAKRCGVPLMRPIQFGSQRRVRSLRL